jgi:hypothetical protein
MVEVAVEDVRAVFRVEGLDKLWAFRSQLEIPLAHISAVDVNHAEVSRWWHGFRLMGTEMPGLLAAGTFFYQGGLAFWDVRDPASTIIVSLDHEHYKKLIVEVADPVATAAMLREALGSSARTAASSR